MELIALKRKIEVPLIIPEYLKRLSISCLNNKVRGIFLNFANNNEVEH